MASLVPNGPLPSKLTLLSGLGRFSPGQKVRFLGCVTDYSTQTACLVLQHNYPPGNALAAVVDVRLLLTTLKSNDTQIGEWVNVIGYIEAIPIGNHSKPETSSISVQALVLWSTGPLQLQAYERSLSRQIDEEDLNSASH